MVAKLSLETTLVASKNQVSADLGDEAVVLRLKDGVFYTLDAVSAHIWKLIQEPRTVHHVLDMLLDEYGGDAERCQRTLIALLTKLARRGLVDVVVDVL